MLRNPASLYERKRSYGLLKYKDFSEMDCVIVRVIQLKDTLDSRVGLIARTGSGKAFYIGNGISKETSKGIAAGTRVSVKYSRKRGDIPLNPVFLKIAASP